MLYSRDIGLERLQTATVTFEVTQGHCYWCHSIRHIRFVIVISLPLLLQLCVSILFPKFKMVTWPSPSGKIYRACL